MDRYITVDELRTRLNIGRSTAYQLIHQEGFPVIRIGKVVRISENQLNHWLENLIKASATSHELKP